MKIDTWIEKFNHEAIPKIINELKPEKILSKDVKIQETY